MGTIDFTPLGFSDLTEDEAFLVSAFRRWSLGGDAYREAANSSTHISKNIRWHDSLQLIFDHFGTSPDPHRQNTKSDSSVLTAVEEAFLTEIGSIGTMPKLCVKAFQRILEEEGATIRRASEIPRSGHDYLLEVIERKTAEVYRVLYPEPQGVRELQNRLIRAGFVGDSQV